MASRVVVVVLCVVTLANLLNYLFNLEPHISRLDLPLPKGLSCYFYFCSFWLLTSSACFVEDYLVIEQLVAPFWNPLESEFIA